MVLWLLAGRDFIPNRQFSFRPSSANILLGEKVYFRLCLRQPDPKIKSVPVTIYFGDAEAGRTHADSGAPASAGRLTAEFLPERIGRYRAVVNVAGRHHAGIALHRVHGESGGNRGRHGRAVSAAIMRSQRRPAVEPGDLPRLLKELNNEKADQTPESLLRPVWNEAWVFYLAGLLFGLDWFLRRRWGLC